MDSENEYIDLTERSFHKFARPATKQCGNTDMLKINIKVSDGTPPAPVKVGNFICYDLGSTSGDYALQFAISLEQYK